MQRFVGVELDENDVEGVAVTFGKMRFEVDGVVLFVITLESALEFEAFGSLIEDEGENDGEWDEDED